jgi:hypothetical protein
VTTYDLLTSVTEEESRAVFEVYDAVFDDQPDYAAWRHGIGLPHERWVLMASTDVDDPARHLYARAGWEVIGPGLRRSGRAGPEPAYGHVIFGFHMA